MKGFLKSLLNQTELGRTAFGFYHVQVAYRKGLIHHEVDFAHLEDAVLPDSLFSQRMAKQSAYLTAYRERVGRIVDKCLAQGIKPILVTQPSMMGDFVDPTTGVSMGNKSAGDATVNSNLALEGRVLELYNDVLRSFSNRVTVVDLAAEMPKDSRYYYDFIHYDNAGAEKVAAILFKDLGPVILDDGRP
jgi:hypothetical protein